MMLYKVYRVTKDVLLQQSGFCQSNCLIIS